MRRSADQRRSLKAHFVAQWGDDCRVLPFGSRTDDEQRGGDVGMLVMSPRPVPDKAWFAARPADHAERLMGGRRVDVPLLDPTTAVQPVHAAALAHGEALGAIRSDLFFCSKPSNSKPGICSNPTSALSQCLIAEPFNVESATALRVDIDQAERTDAFVARFGRLQDTVADKLLPEFLRCLAKPVGAAIDNLDRAEKLGLLRSADDWLASRKLRNRMVRRAHEYVRDAAEWADALNSGHAMVATLVAFAQAILADSRRRGFMAG